MLQRIIAAVAAISLSLLQLIEINGTNVSDQCANVEIIDNYHVTLFLLIIDQGVKMQILSELLFRRIRHKVVSDILSPLNDASS